MKKNKVVNKITPTNEKLKNAYLSCDFRSRTYGPSSISAILILVLERGIAKCPGDGKDAVDAVVNDSAPSRHHPLPLSFALAQAMRLMDTHGSPGSTQHTHRVTAVGHSENVFAPVVDSDEGGRSRGVPHLTQHRADVLVNGVESVLECEFEVPRFAHEQLVQK